MSHLVNTNDNFAPGIKLGTVDKFSTARPKILRGTALEEIKTIQASILRFGLLSPIIVAKRKNRLVVIDGRKRLAAIHRLRFCGQLPRSLVRIPYILLEDARGLSSDTPALMSHRELYETVTCHAAGEQNVEAISKDLFLSRKCVRQIMTLKRLSAGLRQAFFDNIISFDQARAYAALPVIRAQDALFDALGPFASAKDIVKTIMRLREKKVPLPAPAQPEFALAA